MEELESTLLFPRGCNEPLLVSLSASYTWKGLKRSFVEILPTSDANQGFAMLWLQFFASFYTLNEQIGEECMRAHWATVYRTHLERKEQEKARDKALHEEVRFPPPV